MKTEWLKMIKVEVVNDPKFVLTLNLEEAMKLRSMIRNYTHNGSNAKEDREMLEDLFNALNNSIIQSQ